jgi:hypothetical protein
MFRRLRLEGQVARLAIDEAQTQQACHQDQYGGVDVHHRQQRDCQHSVRLHGVGIEMSYRMGLRTRVSADEASKAHINTIAASLLGILALLLGFTFSLSLQPFDSRSAAVVDEANAIGTAYLRAQLLPASVRSDVR